MDEPTDRELMAEALARMGDFLPADMKLVRNNWYEVKVNVFFGGDGNVHLEDAQALIVPGKA